MVVTRARAHGDAMESVASSSPSMVERTCVVWGMHPFSHVVTAFSVDGCPRNLAGRDGGASTSLPVGENDAKGEAIWAWTGGSDGGIVRWALSEEAAESVGADSCGAISLCSGHGAAIKALITVSHAVVSVDESGMVCAWDRGDGTCLSREKVGNAIACVCPTSIRLGVDGDDAIVVAVKVYGEYSREHVRVLRLRSGKVFDLETPFELKDVLELSYSTDGVLTVSDKHGNSHSWRDIDCELKSSGSLNRSSASAFDLTGWNSTAKQYSERSSQPGSVDCNHVVECSLGSIRVHSNETECVVSLNGKTFSLADRWPCARGVTITSCVAVGGRNYAPECCAYGNSDGSIDLLPLYCSSSIAQRFQQHDGAVLALLDYVTVDGQRFIISGGLDGTVQAWDCKSSKALAILRHHQGAVQTILPIPAHGRSSNWDNMFMTVGTDGGVGLVCTDTWNVSFVLKNRSPVVEMIWNAPRGVLAVFSKDESLHVWDVLTGLLERHLSGQSAHEMFKNLREGAHHIVIGDGSCRSRFQWTNTHKYNEPFACKSATSSVFMLDINSIALLDPGSFGIPSQGIKRNANLDSLTDDALPIEASFIDEEVRALHLALALIFPSTSELLDNIFSGKSSIQSATAIGSRGAAVFNLPGVSMNKSEADEHHVLLFTFAILIRISQLVEGSTVSTYLALMHSIERHHSASKIGKNDKNIAFYAYYCMHEVECVKQAAKRLLRFELSKSLPQMFRREMDTSSVSQLEQWDHLAPTSAIESGLLGIIVASEACLLQSPAMHPSWSLRVFNTLLGKLKSSDKRVVFTCAALIADMLKSTIAQHSNLDPANALTQVFDLCYNVSETSLGPTESMIQREVLSDLLSAFARLTPKSFFAQMMTRLKTAHPTHIAHMIGFMALIRVAQVDVHILQSHASHVLETMLMVLNPSNAALRNNCLQYVYALLTELGKSTSMAFHRETHRFAMAVKGAKKLGTVVVVYDLKAGTEWRTLEDNHVDAYNNTSNGSSSQDWSLSNPLNYMSSPAKVPSKVGNGTNSADNICMQSSAVGEDELSVRALSFDREGNQIAAYLDNVSFVYVWDLTPSWRHTFSRGSLSVGTSHYMPCVPSETPLEDEGKIGSSPSSRVPCSLTFVKAKQIRLIYGEVDMVFSFV